MITFKTNNRNNSYTLRKPLKQTKGLRMPIITKYALILLWAYQHSKGQGFSKKYAVAQALGHLDYRYKVWDWSDAEFSKLFSTLNYNRLLDYNHQHRLWFVGVNLKEYLDAHFGQNSTVQLCGWNPYDEAIAYNQVAEKTNTEARTLYRQAKQLREIGKEFFFQD
jgi:hypothetical protein